MRVHHWLQERRGAAPLFLVAFDDEVYVAVKFAVIFEFPRDVEETVVSIQDGCAVEDFVAVGAAVVVGVGIVGIGA